MNQSQSILVVDDDPGIRSLLTERLTLSQYQVTVVENGVEAVKWVKTKKFDLVICDLQMPKMDGIATLTEIKAIDPDLDVIIMTGGGTIETAVEAMKRGALDFILKPFDNPHMLHKIEQALEKTELKTLIGLYESSRLLFSTVDVTEILHRSIDLIRKVFQADEGSIMLMGTDQQLHIAASNGLKSDLIKNVYVAVGERIAGKAVQLRKEFLLHEGLENYPEFKDLPSNPKIKSSIVCPMIVKDKVIGVLCLNRTLNPLFFTNTNLQNATIFASQLAQAVYNADLYKDLQAKVHELEKTHQELQQAQDQLVQSEKLASVGRLVAGIAHEINNPMTAILGFSQLLLEQPLPESIAPHLKVIHKEAERCRKIVSDLLAFSRRRKPVFNSVSVENILDKALLSLEAEMSRLKIEVKKSNEAPLIKVQADSHQLEDVFKHLLSNACYALEKKNGPRKISITIFSKNQNLLISFEDNGVGISDADLKKIFDPFFTTREVGEGAGLGLSLSYGVLQEHGGLLTAQSELGKGSAFTVILPLDLSAQPAISEPQKPQLAAKNGHQVLIVDDESSIVQLMTSMLETKNIQVVTCSNGEQALEKMKAQDFDLIVCDYRMPKMGGRVLYEKTRQIRPDLISKFLFITGFAGGEDDGNFLEKNKIPYLLKPFSHQSLMEAIENRLAVAKP